jgi:hypothetical protein
MSIAEATHLDNNSVTHRSFRILWLVIYCQVMVNRSDFLLVNNISYFMTRIKICEFLKTSLKFHRYWIPMFFTWKVWEVINNSRNPSTKHFKVNLWKLLHEKIFYYYYITSSTHNLTQNKTIQPIYFLIPTDFQIEVAHIEDSRPKKI